MTGRRTIKDLLDVESHGGRLGVGRAGRPEKGMDWIMVFIWELGSSFPRTFVQEQEQTN